MLYYSNYHISYKLNGTKIDGIEYVLPLNFFSVIVAPIRKLKSSYCRRCRAWRGRERGRAGAGAHRWTLCVDVCLFRGVGLLQRPSEAICGDRPCV